MGRLTGKIAIVTGAAKGIGRAIAIKLATEGAKIVINYHGSKEKAEQTLKDIREAGSDGEIYQCDVSIYADTKVMMDYVKATYGSIDILVNNAGITKDGLLMRMSEEQFDQVINTNLKGCFNCMQLVTGIMLKQRSGHMINISSVSGVLGNAGQVNYAASKAGIIGMTKSAAKELGSRGITVNAIAPGFIKTDMTDVLSDAIKEKIVEAIPLKKIGDTEDVANAVAFLASEDAKYITGQVLSVDGGMAM